jgi:NAD(P)-dependent dehydrogenase (short-subunit alcohol dehydrogenase family)
MGLLEGKVVVITGAGGGIGRAEALAFAQEGARVVVNDLGVLRDGGIEPDAHRAEQVAAEVRASGGEAVANVDSVCTPEGAERIVACALDSFGRIDVLVNNAGIVRDRSLLKLSVDDLRAVLEVHVTGTFLCTQAAAKQLVARGEGGRIVNTTSLSGMMGNFGQANYAAANAAVYGLTRTSAIELQKHRITVNALAPLAKTRMTSDLPMFEKLDSLTPEHVAPAAVFLGSSLCGERTGNVLAVSGAQLFAFKVVQTPGRFKDGDDPWTPREIADHWDSILKG